MSEFTACGFEGIRTVLLRVSISRDRIESAARF